MSRLVTALNAQRKARQESEPDKQFDTATSPMDRVVKAHVITRFRLGLLFVALSGLVILAYGYQRYALHPTLTVGSERLTISEVHPATFHDYIPVTGNVVPRNTVYIDAVEGGQVTEVHVEEGALVEAGQSLVTLKNTNLQLEVIGREAQLTEQINNLSMTQLSFEQNRLRNKRDLIDIDYRIENLERQLIRFRKLIDTGSVTQEQLEDLESEYIYQKNMRLAVAESQQVDEQFQSKQIDQLKGAIDSMNRNLVIARDNLDNLTLRAPISGQLTSLEADLGESKGRGQRIGQIDEVDLYKVSALVDEFYLSRVIVGQTATVEIDENDFDLTVTKVYPEVRNRQFEIDLLFNSAPDTIRRGQTMRLRLEIGDTAETLVVENGPFYDDTGGLWVFVVDEKNDLAERRNVQLGRRNPDNIEILGGLANGERVIISSYEHFGETERLILNNN